MVFVSAAVKTVPLEQRNGKPLNSDHNRVVLSAAYAADGDLFMTPVMCGFWLQAMVLDTTSDTFRKIQFAAHRMHATYEDQGMECHYAIAATMRVKLEDPALFDRMSSSVTIGKVSP